MPLGFAQCIASFLVNRKYIIKSGGSITKYEHYSTSSVPQGSHAGPILFNLFCADVIDCTRNTLVKIMAFADDTKLLRHIENPSDRIQLQTVLDKVVNWCETNKLDMNAAKTNHMSYSLSPRNKLETFYFIGTQRISEVTTQKDLGLIFDERLRFTAQSAAVLLRSRALNGAAYRFSRELHHPRLCIDLVRTYIVPVLEYASIIWRRGTDTQNRALEAPLRMSTRWALHLPFLPTQMGYRTYQFRLASLHLLSMEDRYVLQQITFVKKCLRGEYTSNIVNTIQAAQITRERVTRHPNIFNIGTQHIGGPLRSMMMTCNAYRLIFAVEDSIETTKIRLKEHFHQNRQLAIDNQA